MSGWLLFLETLSGSCSGFTLPVQLLWRKDSKGTRIMNLGAHLLRNIHLLFCIVLLVKFRFKFFLRLGVRKKAGEGAQGMSMLRAHVPS